jgi:hypothetical protein
MGCYLNRRVRPYFRDDRRVVGGGANGGGGGMGGEEDDDNDDEDDGGDGGLPAADAISAGGKQAAPGRRYAHA